jgi:hypothetical protein
VLAEIKLLIQANGPMGVRALSRELDEPATSIHRFLTKKQNYLVQTPDRKWALPVAKEDLFPFSKLEDAETYLDLIEDIDPTLEAFSNGILCLTELLYFYKEWQEFIVHQQRQLEWFKAESARLITGE